MPIWTLMYFGTLFYIFWADFAPIWQHGDHITLTNALIFTCLSTHPTRLSKYEVTSYPEIFYEKYQPFCFFRPPIWVFSISIWTILSRWCPYNTYKCHIIHTFYIFCTQPIEIWSDNISRAQKSSLCLKKCIFKL